MATCSYSTLDFDPEKAETVEAEYAGWLAAQCGIPGYEVHVDPDVTWLVQPGMVWRNCAARIRFSRDSTDERLNDITDRFRATKRGAGFWVSQFATPADLPSRLKSLGFRCQKHFPVMYWDLRKMPPHLTHKEPELTFHIMTDDEVFRTHPHPYLGPITTDQRRYELERLTHLSTIHSTQIFNLVSYQDQIPVAVCTLHISNDVAGFHDVGVLPNMRRQGIGSALMKHAGEFARDRGATCAALTASGDGYGMYLGAGFRDVGRIAHWYRQYRDVR